MIPFFFTLSFSLLKRKCAKKNLGNFDKPSAMKACFQMAEARKKLCKSPLTYSSSLLCASRITIVKHRKSRGDFRSQATPDQNNLKEHCIKSVRRTDK